MIIGRSNVGKSTLLNAIVDTQGHPLRRAATSDKPGLTRTLNFYSVGGRKQRPRMALIDAPGYGFAYGEALELLRWHHLTLRFLQSPRPPLRRLLLLLDARHGFKAADRHFLEALGRRVPPWPEYCAALGAPEEDDNEGDGNTRLQDEEDYFDDEDFDDDEEFADYDDDDLDDNEFDDEDMKQALQTAEREMQPAPAPATWPPARFPPIQVQVQA
mmetsp:Transcript_8581/g.24825  ORF Transcript_8581/g.24825 Transcript_8581/m.24825 type:complete len:215 (-) Transcript_8581:81-725(-)